MTTEELAFDILKTSSWLEEVSDALLHRIASVMKPVKAVEGQIFVEEGKAIQDIIILESGCLIRTKLATSDPQELKASRQSIRHLRHDSRIEAILNSSVIVDKLEGKGRMSGLLHSIQPGGVSFATVTAKGDDCKLWLINSTEFRAILGESPDFAMDIMAAMARELRSGTKSLRGLMASTRNKDLPESYDPSVPRIKVMCYDATSWTTTGFSEALKLFNQERSKDVYIDMQFTTERLSEKTAIFSAGFDAVCLFVNDDASSDVLRTLSLLGVGMIAMRCAGFDRVDTKAAKAFGMTVARVPAYSPYAVAEMAIALLMAVNRKTHHASNRVKMVCNRWHGGTRCPLELPSHVSRSV